MNGDWWLQKERVFKSFLGITLTFVSTATKVTKWFVQKYLWPINPFYAAVQGSRAGLEWSNMKAIIKVCSLVFTWEGLRYRGIIVNIWHCWRIQLYKFGLKLWNEARKSVYKICSLIQKVVKSTSRKLSCLASYYFPTVFHEYQSSSNVNARVCIRVWIWIIQCELKDLNL